MQIILSKISRKFNYEWIFRDVDFEFEQGNAYAILGSNGSGKSTLLQIISGHLHPSGGTVTYFHNNQEIPVDDFFRHVTFSGPYLELIEEFTLEEMITFHSRFRKFRHNMDVNAVMEATGLMRNRNKPIKYFSSGMKQRVRLAIALLTESEVVLLDEPAANLDRKAIEWYRSLVAENHKDRIIIVCSNSQSEEHDFCTQSIVIDDYKKIGK
ncbi:MAG: ABC transporter ATP-binding protein [Lentimicrobiaceae bacterium]|jgi:ABC-type multidrug transport system ATPase subunit